MTLFRFALVGFAAAATAYSQTAGPEFEVASVKMKAPARGFHPPSDAGSGGPGTSDPGMFRCGNCTLATLIAKAFDLQPYQLPGREALGDSTFEISAKIAQPATQEEFRAMLRNLLAQRFALKSHFEEKSVRGFQLTVASGGAKLKASGETARKPASPEQHGAWGGHGDHGGLVVFGSFARYNAEKQSIGDLIRVLSDQLSAPVEDRTGLTAQYDINLSWTPSSGGAPMQHSAGGGWNHGDGGGGPVNPGADSPGITGPALAEAVQAQLGLKLSGTDRVAARIFVVDHVERTPTAN